MYLGSLVRSRLLMIVIMIWNCWDVMVVVIFGELNERFFKGFICIEGKLSIFFILDEFFM